MSDAASDSVRPAPRRPGRPRHVTPSSKYLRRREEIVEVAATVFQAKGYEAGSLDDVATALDLRKASLYYYVRSKAELLYLVFDRAISLALQELEKIATSTSPARRLEEFVRHQIRTVASDPSLFAVFFDQRPHLDGEYEAKVRTKELRYLELFTAAITAAIENRVIAVEHPRYTAQMLLGMANWTFKWWDPIRGDIDALADDAVRLVLSDTRWRSTAG